MPARQDHHHRDKDAVPPTAGGAGVSVLKRRLATKRTLRAAAFLLAAFAAEAQAVNYVWDGATSNVWDTTKTNFVGNGNNYWTAAAGPGNIAEFNASFTVTVVATGVTTNGIIFGGGTSALSGGTITLAGTTPTISAALNATGTISSVLAGTAGMIKAGDGTLVISGANTYTGATTVSLGTLTLGAADRLANTSTLNVSGGTFNLGTFAETVAAVTLTSGTITNGTLTGASYALQAGTVSAVLAGAAVTATKTTAGVVTLSGANTFGGAFTLTAGTIQAGSNTALGGGALNLNGGVLSSDSVTARTLANNITVGANATLGNAVNTGALTLSGTVALGTAIRTLTIDSAVSLNGVISGGVGGGLTKAGAGTLTLGAANTFTSAFTLTTGTVRAGNNAALGAGAFNLNGGALSSDSVTARTIGNNITVGGNASLGNAVDTGALTLSGTVALGTAIRTLTIDSAVSLNGVISGGVGGGLTKAGAGTLTLGAANTFTSAFTLTAGTVQAGNNAALGAGAFNLNGGELSSNGATARTIGNNITVGGDAILGDVVNTGALTFTGTVALGTAVTRTLTIDSAVSLNGVISGATGALTKAGAGTLTLGAANTYTGATTVSAGTLTLGAAARIADTSPLNVSGGTFDLGTFAETVAAVTLTGGTVSNGTLTGASYALQAGTVSAVLAGATIAAAKTTAGVVTLTGANTFTGAFTLTAGTVQAGNNAALGAGAFNLNGGVLSSDGATARTIGNNITVGGDATLGNAVNTGDLTLSGTVALGTAVTRTLTIDSAVTLSGVISGATGALTKAGAGTLTLSNTGNTFTGATTVSTGTLATTGNGILATTSGVTISAGATLSLGGNETLNVISNSGTLTLGGVLTTNSASNITVGGTVGGVGSITKNNSGALILTGANDYAGGTTLTAGTIQAGSNTALGGGALNLNGGVLSSDSVTARTLANNITVGGNATLGNATNTGALTLSGTVALGSAVTRTLTIDSAVTLSGVISGATGALTKAGAGTLTLGSANTFTGAFTLSAGTVLAGNDAALGAGAFNLNGGVLSSNGTTARSFANNITVGGNATLGNAVNNGALTLAGTVDLGASGVRTLTIDSAVTLSGAISGASSALTKAGAGTLTLTGANDTWNGTTTISAGTLRATTLASLGSNTSLLALTLGGGTLELGASAGGTVGNVNGNANGLAMRVTANSVIVADRATAGAALAYQFHELAITGNSLSIAAGPNVTSGTAAVTFAGTATFAGNVTLTTGTGTSLTVNEISGSANILKSGQGVLTLAGPSSHANTTVLSGRLNINQFLALGSAAGTLNLRNNVTLDNTSGTSISVLNAKSIGLAENLNFTGSNNLNLGNGTTTLSNSTTINVVAGTLTFGGDVTGVFGITKTGAGVLELAGLTGGGTYTGNTLISEGELFLSGTSSFRTGTSITVDTAGTLRIGASANVANITIFSRPDGVLAEGVINGDLDNIESGTLTRNNNFNGAQRIKTGVVVTLDGDHLGTVPDSPTEGRIVLEDTAGIRAVASFTIPENKGIALPSGSASFDVDTAQALTVASVVTGAGQLTATGAGELILDNVGNTYSGGTLVSSSNLGVTSDGSLGAVGGAITLSSGNLVLVQNLAATVTTATINSSRPIRLANGTENSINAQTGRTLVYDGIIAETNPAGTASSLRLGTTAARFGTVQLGGANTYQGATSIEGGVVEIAILANGGTASGLGQSSNSAANLHLAGGTLRFTGATGSTDRLFTLGYSGGTLDTASGTLAFTNSGTIALGSTASDRVLTLAGSGSGSLAASLVDFDGSNHSAVLKTGSGTWTLSGNSTFTDGVTIDAGKIRVGHNSALGAGTLTLNGGGVSSDNANGRSLANNLVIGGDTTLGNSTDNGALTLTGTVALGASATRTLTIDSAVTMAGEISGAGAGLVKAGSGTLTVTGANTYTGATSVTSGKLNVTDLGDGENASSLGISDLTDPTKLVVGSGAVLNVQTNSDKSTSRSLTLAEGATLTSSGTGGITFTSNSRLALAGANPTLRLGGTGTGDNRFESSLSLDSNPIAEVIKEDNGTWVLAGPRNRFRGDVRVEVAGGIIGLASQALPTGATIDVSNSAPVTVRWESGNTDDLSSNLAFAAGANVTLNMNGNVALNNALTFRSGQAIGLTKTGSGTMTLNGDNSAFVGTFTQSEGTTNVTSATALGSAAVSVSGGLIKFNAAATNNVAVSAGGTIGGTGSVGAVNIGAGGVLSPGNSPGTLTMTSLTAAPGSSISWQVHDTAGVPGTGWDQIVVSGIMDLSALSGSNRLQINVISLSQFTDTTPGNAVNWDKENIYSFLFGNVDSITWNTEKGENIADYFSFNTSAFTTSDGSSVGSAFWSMSYNEGTGDLTLTAVPEPSTYGLGIGALGLAIAAIRRRRKKQA